MISCLCKGLKKSVLSFFLLLFCMPSFSFAAYQQMAASTAPNVAVRWHSINMPHVNDQVLRYSEVLYGAPAGWQDVQFWNNTAQGYLNTGKGASAYVDRCYRLHRQDDWWGLYEDRYCIPPVTEPASCADGVVSGSETGIDCGDSECVDGDDVCTTYCPAGFVSEFRQGLEYCYSADDTPDYTVDAKLGICPSNLFVSSTDPTKCVSSALPTWASSDYLDPVETDPADSTPWNNVFTDENTTFTTEQYNTAGVITDVSTATTTGTATTGEEVVNTETTTTVTELDGSKVETTVADTTNRDSGGVVTGTTTTTVRTYDPSGTLTAETSQVEQVGSSEDAGAPFVAPGEGEAYVLDEQKAGQFATRYTDFSTAVTGAPVFAPIASLFDGPDTSGKTSVFTMSMGSYGSQSLDLTNYDSAFSVLGKIFVFLSLLAAGRLVFINRGS